MKALKNKMGKNGGFTLVEMLIVVAIIAILVAVSIPLVNTSLERARQATDAANERAAKAEGAILYLNDKLAVGDFALYNAGAGQFGSALTTAPTAATYKYGKCDSHKQQDIYIEVKAGGEIAVSWTGGNNPHAGTVPD